MSKKKIEELTQREERIRSELKRVQEQKRQEAGKEARQRRKKVDHAKYIVAGFILEKARGDASSKVWQRINEIIADPKTREYDRRCLEELKVEYGAS